MKKNKVLGISACLLGHEVRHDGGHCKNRYVVDTLSEFFDFRAVCPEVEYGFGIPRPTLQLRKEGDSIRLIERRSLQDHTEGMKQTAREIIKTLKDAEISGFILKRNSPSCGLERVRVHQEKGQSRDGVGLFVQVLQEELPFLPLEEDGRLQDARLREHFIERVFAYQRWKTFIKEDHSLKGLMAFHAAHKLQAMAHSPHQAKTLGRIVGTAGNHIKEGVPLDNIVEHYGEVFLGLLQTPISRGRHVNVLQHLVGYLKKILPSEDKQELHSLFLRYKEGLVPLSVPLTLLRHHFRKLKNTWIDAQVYLEPYPERLALNHYLD